MTGRLLAYCARQGFPLAGHSVLCAVSGGVDSMTLLHLLWTLREAGVLTLTAASFDHRLRPGSGEDAAFVERWCRAHGIACVLGGGDVAEYAAARGESLEQAGRVLRYRFLEETRQAVGADYLATAHNADDNAETVLLHLLRGSGLRGLGGIPPMRGSVIRPLLWLERRDIEAYAAAHHIPRREDESNADVTYTRNFLRHQVLPLLKTRNPNLTDTLCRTAEGLRRDEDCLSALTAAELEGLNGAAVPAARLLALPAAVSLRLVQALAERAGAETVLSHTQRTAVLALAAGEDPSGRLNLPGGLTARREYDLLRFEQTAPPETFVPFALGDGESRAVPELGVTFFVRRVVYARERPGRVYLRGEGTEILFRPRRTGDSIRLPRRGTKRVKKWMIEARLPSARRGLVPVLEISGALAALWQMGRDERWLPQPGQPAWEIWSEERKEYTHEDGQCRGRGTVHRGGDPAPGGKAGRGDHAGL